MSILTLAAVALGGFLGAPARFLLNRAIPHKNFPWGLLAVNTLGAFLVGVFLANTWLNQPLKLFLVTGFCGALTSFSALAFDLNNFLEDKKYLIAIFDAFANLSLGILAVWLGTNMVFS